MGWGKQGRSMLKLNRLTDYAVVILGQLAKNSGEVETAAELAAATGIPLPTVSKILKILSGAGIIASHRGANGGYSFERSARDVRVAEIIEAFEGPIALTACVDSATEHCSIEALCPMKGNWNKVNDAIRKTLFNLTLADLIITVQLDISEARPNPYTTQSHKN